MRANADRCKQVRELTGGGVHYSFEALGTKATAEQAFGMLRPAAAATIIAWSLWVKIELHATTFSRSQAPGHLDGRQPFSRRHAAAVVAVAAGRLKLDHLISGRLKLEQVNEGFAALKSGAPVRQLIDFAA